MIGTGLAGQVFESAALNSAGIPEVFSADCLGTVTTPSEELTACAMNQFADLRDEHEADVVLMVVNDMNRCGGVPPQMVGQGAPTISPENEDIAYAVVKVTCITAPSNNMRVAAHELGHLLSLEHKENDPNPDLPVTFNHAATSTFLFLAGELTADADPSDVLLCTIGLLCQFHGFFSGDGITFPNGDPAGDAEVSDSRRVIEEFSWEVVACYRECETLLLIGADVALIDEGPHMHALLLSEETPPFRVEEPTYFGPGAVVNNGSLNAFSWFGVQDPMFALGEDDFTVEMFFYFINGFDWHTIAKNGALETGWFLSANEFGGLRLAVEGEPGSSSDPLVAGAAFSPGEWNHIALVRDGDDAYVFIEGELVIDGQAFFADQSFASTDLFFGGAPVPSNGLPFNALWAYMDEIRVSRGSIYTGNFTPPAEPFPRPIE